MRDILDAVADGRLTPEAAEAELTGYVTTDAGRYDAARPSRRGIPEAVFAEGKSVEEIESLTKTAIDTTGRALVTRASDDALEHLRVTITDAYPEVDIERRGTTGLYTLPSADRPSLSVSVGIVTGGTVDRTVADEAHLVCLNGGIDVTRIDDIGVASLDRALDQIDRLRSMDVLIVAAGREGSLPTVIAGLVDTPVIGLPVSSGYGYGGRGEAALSGMLQSCTVLSVVNIDAGFVAGAQATLIARAIAGGRTTATE